MSSDRPQWHCKAPAKLNLCLKVTGRRPDGYHNLISLMVPVALFDELRLRPGPPGLRLVCGGPFHVAGTPDNLVLRAAELFFARIGQAPALDIHLTKCIPLAAGLGGGSSDAAATLKALNRIFAAGLTLKDLAALAVRLGADVPFFLYEQPCLAQGIGDILEPIPLKRQWFYVIVTPPILVSTAWVYARLNLTLTDSGDNSILSLIKKGPFHVADLLLNDLEKVTSSHFPIINLIKRALLEAGAEGALMSGSGPSVFGVFESAGAAHRAVSELGRSGFGSVFDVMGVTESDWGVVKR